MVKMKKREKVIDYLRRKGCQEVPCRSGKYRQFTHPGPSDRERFYFVGKAGALRLGESASKSVSLTRFVEEKI